MENAAARKQQYQQQPGSSPLSSLGEQGSPLSLLKSERITLALPKRLKRVRTFPWYHSNVPILSTLQRQVAVKIGLGSLASPDNRHINYIESPYRIRKNGHNRNNGTMMDKQYLI